MTPSTRNDNFQLNYKRNYSMVRNRTSHVILSFATLTLFDQTNTEADGIEPSHQVAQYKRLCTTFLYQTFIEP
jgi:hypothetical protein